jgi:hypothetical protein
MHDKILSSVYLFYQIDRLQRLKEDEHGDGNTSLVSHGAEIQSSSIQVFQQNRGCNMEAKKHVQNYSKKGSFGETLPFLSNE